jgi:uncharacterized phiE125 gp8 family phage protein
MYKLITPPAGLAITLADVKAYLNISSSTKDAMITSILKGAIEQAQEYAWCQFVNATWEKQFVGWPMFGNNELILGRGYVSSITSITYNDEAGTTQTWNAANYALDNYSTPNAVKLIGDEWPTLNSKNPWIRVRFVAGFGADDTAVPDDIKDALRLMVVQNHDVRGDERPAMPKASEKILNRYRMKFVNQ